MEDPTRTCPDCGAPRPADAPRGLCPACLMRAALPRRSGDDPLGPAELTVSFVPAGAADGVLATLAQTHGGIPRVLLRDTDGTSGPDPVVQPASSEMPPLADRSAHLQLLGEIARGGMGAILKGRDVDLGRDLAIKVLLERHRDRPELVRRFVEEAQIAGQLQHPGVVPVYELGTFTDARPFFSMRLVKGRTLAELLAGRAGAADEQPRLLGIFEALCQTMAYVHSRGVIHRDLKPSNIMVGAFGEVQVMDWGIAKVLPRGGLVDDAEAGKAVAPDPETLIATARSGSDSDLSLAGSVMGTPAYMAPEQARGEVDRLDERADVFAMGSILCEILTRHPAFVGRSSGEIQRKAARGELGEALARLESCGADAELVALARDCLAPERDDRPPSAMAVAGRITAYQRDVQERLRAAGLARVAAETRAEEEGKRRLLADRLALEERRKRRASLALAASVLLSAALAGGGWFWVERGRGARRTAVAAALAEARLLQSQARRSPTQDPSRWAEALSVIKHAEGLLAGAAEPGLARQVADLRAQVEADARSAEADRELLARLVDIRSSEGDDRDGSASDASYGAAFRAAGLDVDAIGSGPAAAEIKARRASVALALASGLDDWANQRRKAGPKDRASWLRLVDTARAVDPDPKRDDLRALWSQPDLKSQLEPLRRLAREADVATWPAMSLNQLALALGGAGDVEAGVDLLRRAVVHRPDDVWTNYNLASLLAGLAPPRTEEAIGYYTAARALRPETGHGLADALAQGGREPEAIAILRDLVRLRPNNALHLHALARMLQRRGDLAEAGAAFDRATAIWRDDVRLRPDDATAHNNLGVALSEYGRPEAVAEYREAIRLKPDNALFHNNLGLALQAQGRLDEAIAAFREAARLVPGYRTYLQNALARQGQLDPAIAACREEVRRHPGSVEAFEALATALLAKGRRDELIEECRAAIRLKPDFARAHSYLGVALNQTGHRPEAIAAWREAARLDPDHRMTWYWLGRTLLSAGEIAAAADALRRAQTLDSAQYLARAESYVAMEKRLPAVLNGEEALRDNAERLDFARMCYALGRYATSARLFTEAYAEDPKLVGAEDIGKPKYAASSAALAGCGKGKDDPPPDEAARARLRGQALAWLRAILERRRARIDESAAIRDPAGKAPQYAPVLRRVQDDLKAWKADRDFAGVRDPEALARLPEEERTAWRAFWDEIDAVLKRSPSDRP